VPLGHELPCLNFNLHVLAERPAELSPKLQRALRLPHRREGRAIVSRRVGDIENRDRASLDRPNLRHKIVGVGKVGTMRRAGGYT
jgi:hypothetical protein